MQAFLSDLITQILFKAIVAHRYWEFAKYMSTLFKTIVKTNMIKLQKQDWNMCTIIIIILAL